MMQDPDKLAEGWGASFDRSMGSVLDGEARRRALANLLIFHLAMTELDWVHPVMADASRSRAQNIVSEIGWPRERWLKPRVAAERRYWQRLHNERLEKTDG